MNKLAVNYLTKEDINRIQYWLRFNTDIEYFHFIYFLISTENVVGIKLNDIILLRKSEIIDLLIHCNITDDLQEEIEDYLNMNVINDNFVFISRKKRIISRIQVFRVLNDAATKSGVNKRINQKFYIRK